MPTLSSHTIALFIVLVVAFVGAIVAYVRDRARFHGYKDISREVMRLARTLNGEVFRDGEDLVASGSWNELPAQVRFSHASNTPGLDIRLGAPAGFSLSVMSVRAPQGSGRVRVRTPDEIFNARFVVRSDDPTQAHFFLDDRQVMAGLRKLCHSSETFLLFSKGVIEFGELGEPNPQSARNAFEYLESLGRLSEKLCAMPGAQSIKIERLKRHRGWAVRVALAAGIVASVAGLIMEARPHPNLAKPQPAHVPQESISQADAKFITGAANWHLAGADELDAAALTWARGQRYHVESHVKGNFCPGSNANDVAYLLAGPDPMRRLVLLCRGEAIYDSKYPYIGIAVRVSQEQIRSIQWAVKPAAEPEGDGLLITRAPDDPASGLVLFTRGHHVLTGVPLNYQKIKLD